MAKDHQWGLGLVSPVTSGATCQVGFCKAWTQRPRWQPGRQHTRWATM